jgi:hypothetical protein
MRIFAKNAWQVATYDGLDAGEGLAIFFSQSSGDEQRYHFIVKAITDQDTLVVGQFFTSPPSATDPAGPLTRMVAAAVCPGAKSWTVEVKSGFDPSFTDHQNETADLVLTSSKCYTAPVGVTRVSERYAYRAGTSGTLTIRSGQRIVSWSAIAIGGTAGSVTIGSGNTVVIPANSSVSAEPGSGLLQQDNIVFVNCDWFVELLESA